MGNNSIGYHNKEYQLINIPGTDLYRYEIISGVDQNGYKRNLNYRARQTADIIPEDDAKVSKRVLEESLTLAKNSKYDALMAYLESKLEGAKYDASSRHSDYVYLRSIKLYKKPRNMPEKDLREAIKSGAIQPIVSSELCTDDHQNYILDDNGNLILKKAHYDLEDVKRPGGNLLINRNGVILRDAQKNFIHPHNAFCFYPLDIFVEARVHGKSETIGIRHNFLDANGSQISIRSFEHTPTPTVTPVSYDFTSVQGPQKLFTSKHKINPTGYVYSDKDHIQFYPSATALLIANREGLDDMPIGFIADEKPYLKEHYRRLRELPSVIYKINELLQAGKITDETHASIMKHIRETEQLYVKSFIENDETAEDIIMADSHDDDDDLPANN